MYILDRSPSNQLMWPEATASKFPSSKRVVSAGIFGKKVEYPSAMMPLLSRYKAFSFLFLARAFATRIAPPSPMLLHMRRRSSSKWICVSSQICKTLTTSGSYVVGSKIQKSTQIARQSICRFIIRSCPEVLSCWRLVVKSPFKICQSCISHPIHRGQWKLI